MQKLQIKFLHKNEIMTITGKTKMHLNRTYYFDDEGFPCNTLKEARDSSYDPTCITVVRKQNCYFREFTELTNDQRDEAEFMVDRLGLKVKPWELVYIVSASNDQIILINYWNALQEDLDNNIYTLVEEKRN